MTLQEEDSNIHTKREQAVFDKANVALWQLRYATPETLQRVLCVRERLMQESKGNLFEDTAELIHQMREERTRELEQAIRGDSAESRQPMTLEEIEALDQLREQIIQKLKRKQTQQ